MFSFQEETVVVDIERGVILPSLSQFRTDAKSEDNNTKPFINYAAVMGFPKSVTAELISSLKTLLPIKSPSNADRKLQKVIFRFNLVNVEKFFIKKTFSKWTKNIEGFK